MRLPNTHGSTRWGVNAAPGTRSRPGLIPLPRPMATHDMGPGRARGPSADCHSGPAVSPWPVQPGRRLASMLATWSRSSGGGVAGLLTTMSPRSVQQLSGPARPRPRPRPRPGSATAWPPECWPCQSRDSLLNLSSRTGYKIICQGARPRRMMPGGFGVRAPRPGIAVHAVPVFICLSSRPASYCG